MKTATALVPKSIRERINNNENIQQCRAWVTRHLAEFMAPPEPEEDQVSIPLQMMSDAQPKDEESHASKMLVLLASQPEITSLPIDFIEIKHLRERIFKAKIELFHRQKQDLETGRISEKDFHQWMTQVQTESQEIQSGWFGYVDREPYALMRCFAGLEAVFQGSSNWASRLTYYLHLQAFSGSFNQAMLEVFNLLERYLQNQFSPQDFIPVPVQRKIYQTRYHENQIALEDKINVSCGALSPEEVQQVQAKVQAEHPHYETLIQLALKQDQALLYIEVIGLPRLDRRSAQFIRIYNDQIHQLKQLEGKIKASQQRSTQQLDDLKEEFEQFKGKQKDDMQSLVEGVERKRKDDMKELTEVMLKKFQELCNRYQCDTSPLESQEQVPISSSTSTASSFFSQQGSQGFSPCYTVSKIEEQGPPQNSLSPRTPGG